ncbi:hypothetical protein [Solirubrobacter soli]|uniref:hypothetical protein n=1 Tax=Solirubrobacter soli TaxID=363832 RepID=UPI000429B4D1|nr:hypothetical protein [Solirubrobacter soli]
MRIPPPLVVVAPVAGWQAASGLTEVTMRSLPPTLLSSSQEGDLVAAYLWFATPSPAHVVATGVAVTVLFVLSFAAHQRAAHALHAGGCAHGPAAPPAPGRAAAGRAAAAAGSAASLALLLTSVAVARAAPDDSITGVAIERVAMFVAAFNAVMVLGAGLLAAARSRVQT